MRKQLLILIIATSLLGSCSWRSHWPQHNVADMKKPVAKSSVHGTVNHKTSAFTKVFVTGEIDVYLHTNAKYYQITLSGDADDIANTMYVVKDNQLNVTLGKGYPKRYRPRLDIYMHSLTSFTYHGLGDIFAKNISSQCMSLLIDNKRATIFEGSFSVRDATFMNTGRTGISGIQGCAMQMNLLGNADVKLIGYANIATINMSENSKLSLYWVKSKSLEIKLKDKARVQLSGISETLNADLYGSSRFNGRYLMSQNSFVKTYDNSTVEISVTKNQRTLANDQSNIYYYFLPETKTDFMAENGSVLDMREWERPFFKKSDRYNSY